MSEKRLYYEPLRKAMAAGWAWWCIPLVTALQEAIEQEIAN